MAAALYTLLQIPLPFTGELEWFAHPLVGSVQLRLLPQSYAVILGWFVLVEIAAWAVPSWRTLRCSGAAGRHKLNRVTLHLAVGFSAIQVYGLGLYLQSEGVVGPRVPPLWFISGAAAACAVFVLVGFVERHGIGRGWSILALAMFTDGILADVRFSASGIVEFGPLVFAIAIVLAVVTVGFLQAGTGPAPRRLPLPTTGLVPFIAPGTLAVSLVVDALGGLRDQERQYELTPADLLMYMMIVVVLGVVCHHVYFGDAVDQVGADAARRSLITSLVFLALIAISDHLLAAREVWVYVPAWVFVVAISHDLYREARFRQRHGELVVVATLNRLAEQPQIMERLAAALVPAIALGKGHRSMLHFFGPYVPVDVAVPVGYERSAARSGDGDDETGRV